MSKIVSCACRLACEEIELSDGSRLLVCVGCETYAERTSYRGRLFAMSDRPLRDKLLRPAPRRRAA